MSDKGEITMKQEILNFGECKIQPLEKLFGLKPLPFAEIFDILPILKVLKEMLIARVIGQ
jgi:hypothetical protein